MAKKPLMVDGVLVPEPDLSEIGQWWEPRFAASGVDHNIIVKLKGEIGSWSEWCRRWSDAGDDLSSFAADAADRGAMLTAGESLVQSQHPVPLRRDGVHVGHGRIR